VALGPGAPVGNHNVRADAFSGLQSGDCEHVVDVGRFADGQAKYLYRGVGNACLAAFDNRLSLWDEAEQDHDSIDVDSFHFTCYDRAAYQLFTTLVTYHRRDAQRQFTKTGGQVVADSCPRVTELQPSSGSADGGYPVTVIGENFPSPAEVQLVPGGSTDETLTAEPEPGGRRLTIQMPPADGRDEVYLVVQSGGADSGLPFTYIGTGSTDAPTDGSTETAPVPTESPTDTPTELPTHASDEPS
jgi:hypothetical protein